MTAMIDGAAISRRAMLGLGGMAVLGTCLGACSGERDQTTVRIATGGTKGVYYSYGVQMATTLTPRLGGIRLRAVPTSGSVDNLTMLARGEAGLAIVAADAALDAASGRAGFDAPVPIRAIARLYDDVIHLVVRADSAIFRIADLVGHRVSLGSRGSGTELIARRLLEVAGVSVAARYTVPLGINECVDALAAGRIDAFFWSGGLPTVGVTELSRQVPIRMVDLGGLSDGMRSAYGLSYRRAGVPAGTYGIPRELSTIAVPNYLVVDRSLDEQVVFDVTRELFACRGEMARQVSAVGALDIGQAIYTSPIDLHPGALRFYRESRR